MIPYGITDFQQAYQVSPIILTGGIFGNMPGAGMPIVNITEANNFNSPLSYGNGTGLDDYFAQYYPLPGSNLIDQEIGAYPFANQAVAANAVITRPLTISLMMICPVRGDGDYWTKQAILTSLRQTLAQHNISGGTYAVLTPAYSYFNCIMTGMRDVSSADSKQVQWMYQIDFVQPLITLQEAGTVQNNLMSRMTNQLQITNANWSGQQPAIGNPASGVLPPTVPSSQTSPGAGPSLTAGSFQPTSSPIGSLPSFPASPSFSQPQTLPTL
jgi:hypothetical protein